MMKNPFEIRKKEILPRRWAKRAKKYLLYCPLDRIEWETQQIDSGVLKVREITEAEHRAALDRWGVDYDPLTGRPTPYWVMIQLPYHIFFDPRQRIQFVADQENYDEYIRTIARMLDVGVKAVAAPPEKYTEGIGSLMTGQRHE